MNFTKPALTTNEQIKKLQNRGMIIPDIQKASHYLSNINYYRLSAYFHIFLEEPKENHIFKPETTFDRILNIYVFDRRLRVLLFDEIERIEIAFRTQLILCYSLEFGNNWYENPQLFYNPNDYKKSLGIIQDTIRTSNEVFIKHYKQKYTNPVNPPAWMTIELISLTQLSIIYKNLRPSNAKKQIAAHFGINSKVLESWLETLSLIRNLCAHHSRLWNRNIPKPPENPTNPKYIWTRYQVVGKDVVKLYTTLRLIQYLIKIINPQTHFARNLILLLAEYPDVSRVAMGIPDNWEEEAFWK